MKIFSAIFISILFFGCVYTFTGASIQPHLKTIAIPLFDDRSGFGEPNVKEKLTSGILDLFIRDNTLSISDRMSADAVLEGAVISINDAPAIIEKGERIGTRRLTIIVHIVFNDLQLRKKIWEKDFSQYGDYETSGQNRTIAIDEAIKKISEDILLQTVSGW